ncbi:MAG: cupin domain-containing protein [Halobacteriales archaeon]
MSLEDHEGVEGTFRRSRLARGEGDHLGCSYYEVPPGGRPWSYHYHVANAEALYVLSGVATVETPGGDVEVDPGGYLAFPAGPEGVHAIRNEGDEPVRYLVVSTTDRPDVTVLPRRGLFSVRLDEDAEPADGPAVSGFYPVDARLED